MAAAPQDRKPAPVARLLLFIGGSLALAAGVLGAFLPLLPTTPFVLLAAGCYSRGYAPAHRWLRESRYFGPICRSGQEGRYLPPRAKAIALTLTTLSFGATMVFAVKAWWLRGLIFAIGVAVVTWLLRMPTTPRVPVPVTEDAG